MAHNKKKIGTIAVLLSFVLQKFPSRRGYQLNQYVNYVQRLCTDFCTDFRTVSAVANIRPDRRDCAPILHTKPNVGSGTVFECEGVRVGP